MDNSSTEGPTTEAPVTTDVQISEYFGPYSLLSQHREMAIPYITATVLAVVVGIIGNSLIIVAQITKKKVRTRGSEFQANMAVADLIITGIADPLCIIGAVGGEEFFRSRAWLCDVIGSVCLTSCISAFLSLSALTFNSYINVCHHAFYARIFSRRNKAIICVVIWITAALCDLPNFINISSHGFDNVSHQCIWQRTGNRIYSAFIAICLLLTPIVLMNIAFGRIFVKVWKSSVHVHPLTTAGSKNVGSSDVKLKKTMRRCRGTFPIVVAYTICWTPYAISLLADFENEWPFWTHLWMTFLAHLHSTLPFFILAASHDRYREAFKAIVCLKRGMDSTTSSDDSAAKSKKVSNKVVIVPKTRMGSQITDSTSQLKHSVSEQNKVSFRID